MSGRFLKNLRKKFQDELAHASSTAEESISNIITVRSFSNESKMVDIYSDDIDKSYYLGRKLAFLIGLFMGVVSMFMYVSCFCFNCFFLSIERLLCHFSRELQVLCCGMVVTLSFMVTLILVHLSR
jgi:ABC-type multidrug transport system fused ATPase/permease subunit